MGWEGVVEYVLESRVDRLRPRDLRPLSLLCEGQPANLVVQDPDITNSPNPRQPRLPDATMAKSNPDPSSFANLDAVVVTRTVLKLTVG